MMTTYEQAVEYFHHIPRRQRLHSLDTMKRLMEELGNPQDRIPCVHIGGTNGKGTTANFCANMLTEAGYRTGLFTSPYVMDFRERFCCDGTMISKEELIDCAQKVKEADEKLRAQGIAISEFEAVTAAGFLWFSQCCDILCLEVGMGGRYDATNIASRTLVSVITSISLDHTQYLGDTIEQIAKEKAGIVKPGGVCVCYPKLSWEALGECMEECAKKGASLVQGNPGTIEILRCDGDGSKFRYGTGEYEIQMAGEHQIYNAVNALEAIGVLGQKGFPVSLRDQKAGLLKTRVPARFQKISGEPLVYVDGAHNPEGLEALADTLKKLTASPKVVILGMMQDKDCQTGANAIAFVADEVFCVPVNYPRTISAEDLWELVKDQVSQGQVCQSLEQAIRVGLDHIASKGVLVICGSFYLAEQAEQYFHQKSLYAPEV